MSLCFIIQWIVLVSNICVSARTTFVSVPVLQVSFVDSAKLCFQCQGVFYSRAIHVFSYLTSNKTRGEQTSDLSACCFSSSLRRILYQESSTAHYHLLQSAAGTWGALQ